MVLVGPGHEGGEGGGGALEEGEYGAGWVEGGGIYKGSFRPRDPKGDRITVSVKRLNQQGLQEVKKKSPPPLKLLRGPSFLSKHCQLQFSCK